MDHVRAARDAAINVGQTRQLTFRFQSNADTNLAHYAWNVDFGGCTVTNSWGQPGSTCPSLMACTPPYPFASSNPLTSLVFSESEELEATVVGFASAAACAPAISASSTATSPSPWACGRWS